MVLVSSLMTTNLTTAMNESNDAALDDKEVSSKAAAGTAQPGDAVDPASPHHSTENSKGSKSAGPASNKSAVSDTNYNNKAGVLSPNTQQVPTGMPISAYPVNNANTPQQPMAAYYLGYPQSQITPEPPSPATQGPTMVSYEGLSFFQQPGVAAFAPHAAAFGNGPSTPLSPPRPTTHMGTGVIPPASPLFPRITNAGPGPASAALPAGLDVNGQRHAQGGAPPSPNLPYMSPPFGSVMYQPYPVSSVGVGGPQQSNSSDDGYSWNDRNSGLNQNAYQQSSPQIQGMMHYGGMTSPRAGVGGRANSFEEAMLPPSALEQQDHAGNPAYSPYSTNQQSPGPAGATLFAQQGSWGYAGPPDMYSSPGTPLQPRPSTHPQAMGMYPSGPVAGQAAGMRPMAPYGQYFPASSPGPPIQTTVSNKGPDGANLFIFHIPNHFTNLDMYQLFCPYGNLLSVRIMVEKDTGRSRGFGFVSYDNPESAALAIKELNGFAIGNKRLKVQHKQIRPRDLHLERDSSPGGSFGGVAGAPDGYGFHSSLPPSGPMSQNNWFDGSGRNKGVPNPDQNPHMNNNNGGKQPEDGTELTQQSTSTSETAQQQQQQLHHHAMTTGGVMGGPTNESPLATMGTLQNALPDVAGNGNNQE